MSQVVDKLIIFQPGSFNFLFGTPSQLTPYVLPSVIAFRNEANTNKLVTISSRSKYDFRQADFDSLLDVARTLKLFVGESNPKFDYGQVEYNSQQRLGESEKVTQHEWLHPVQYKDLIIGESVLKMDPETASSMGFDIKWVFEHMSCFENRLLSEQEKCLMANVFIEAIATVYPKLPASSYKTIKFILLIPDSFNRDIVLGMIDVLFRHVKLEAGTILQESVAVSYFLKTPKLCVVDIGHRKISISCVEEGISLTNSRIHLNYGSDLVMGSFHQILKNIKWPFKDLNPEKNFFHWQFLQESTFRLCHLLKGVKPGAAFDFEFSQPGSKVLKFSTKFGDEPLLAPMSLFCQVFLKSLGFKTACTFKYTNNLSVHDVLEDEQLLELALSLEQVSKNSTSVMERRNSSKTDLSAYKTAAIDIKDGVIPLDEAVYKSISTCGNNEVKADYFSKIYIVGCGANIAGIAEFLKHRLQAFIPRGKGLKFSAIEVNSDFKDCAPEHVAWKGACIAVNNRCFSDFLIQSNNWENQGVRAVREKVIFEWTPMTG